MPDGGGLRELGKDLAPAVSWLLVILGWIVVSRDHNRRAQRNETRAQIGKIQDLIDRVEATAFKYWTSTPDGESAKMAADLKRDLQRLARQLSRLCKACAAVAAQNELIEFRRAVTGGDFESQSRAAISPDSGKLHEIWGAAQDLIEKIESGFAAHYPVK